MTRGLVLGLCVVAAMGQASRPTRGCQVGLETVNWVREQLGAPGLSPTRLEELLATLELRTGSCATEGDIWYYRAEVERALARPASVVEYSLGKAREFRAPALEAPDRPASPEPRQPPSAGVPGAPAAATVDLDAPIERKWAVIVGVGRYRDRRIQALPLAAKDARDLREVLADRSGGRFHPDRVRVVTDEEATLDGIRRAIGWVREQAAPRDQVVLFFAGHGSPREFDPNGVSYVLAHDTDTSDAASLYATSLQMVDLVEIICRDLRAAQVVLILDTCYSGAASVAGHRAALRIRPTPQAPFSVALSRLAATPGRAVLASSRADERSWESARRQNGYFTHFLMAELRDRGAAPLRDLFAAVSSRVTDSVRDEVGQPQHPVFDAAPHADRIVLAAPSTLN